MVVVPLDFHEIESALAEPFLMKMNRAQVLQNSPSVPLLRMELGEFDHFEPLWKFLRGQGVEKLYYFDDFLILPAHIVAATQVLSSLWPEIQRTRQFFHPDDDPFWHLRDVFERLADSGSGLLAVCD